MSNETRESSFAVVAGRGVAGAPGARGVVVRDGRIDRLLPDRDADRLDGAIDVGDAWLAPGFVDIHTHGLDGVGPEGLDADGLARLSAAHARHGVTSFVVSTMTAPEASLVATLRVAAAAPPLPGARFVGVHLEGPFLDPASAGAQNPEHCRPADVAECERLLDAGGGCVRMMTLAPEHDADFAVIRRLCAAGVVVALGHSAADASLARAAVDAGARVVTHLYNGMARFHHRDAGLVGLALTDPRVTAELIVDGIHVDATAVSLAIAAKGIRGVALISDSIPAAGMGDGRFTLGDEPVVVDGGVARREGGALAGSTLTLDAAVRRVRIDNGVTIDDAVAMASTVPARTLGLDGGVLTPGAPADLVALDDDGPCATWVDGRRVWRR